MRFTDNYNLNLPDLADQYNLEHWNENTSKIDEQLKFCENNIETLQQKHQDDTTAINMAILENKNNLATETSERKMADENLQSQMLRQIKKRITFTIKNYSATLYPSDLGLEQFDENAIIQITTDGWNYLIYFQNFNASIIPIRFVTIDSASGSSSVTLVNEGTITCEVKYIGK